MTCIAAIAHGPLVTMAGDSAASYAGTQLIRRDGKVDGFGEFVVGSSGSTRVADLLRFSYRPRQNRIAKARFGLDAYMAVDFVGGLREFLKKSGSVTKSSSGKDTWGEDGAILVGIRGRLYFIDHQFSLVPLVQKYFAIGSGGDLALGSLASTEGSGLNPHSRLLEALEIAARYCETVAEPFTFVTTKRKRK